MKISLRRRPSPAPSSAVLASSALGVSLRLGGVAAFAAMMALLKYAMAEGASVVDVMFYRNAFALPVIFIWVFLSGGLASIRTQKVAAHAMRGIVGLAVMLCTFVALSLLPLAQATAIGFLAPIFATILSALMLQEAVRGRQWAALIMGFVGILIIVQPSGDGARWLGLSIALLAALGSAAVSILLRQIGRSESAVTTVFWFNILTVGITSIPFLLWQGPMAEAIFWPLVAAGLMGGLGQILITASVRYAPLAVLSPFDYLQIIWAAGWSYLLFSQPLTTNMLMGAALIVLSGMASYQHKKREELPIT